MLPFVVAPTAEYEKIQVGTPEIGVLEIEKHESLSLAEQNYIKSQKLFNYRNELASLARRISQATGKNWAYINNRINAYVFGGVVTGDAIEVNGRKLKVVALEDNEGGETIATVEEVADSDEICVRTFAGKNEIVLISDRDGNFNEKVELVTPDWYSDFYPEIKTLEDNYLESFRTQNAVYATAIVKFRLNPEWELEHTLDPKLIKPELVLELAKFAYKEKNGWEEIEPEPATEATEEELGKSSKKK